MSHTATASLPAQKSPQPSSGGPLLAIEPNEFASHFSREPFLIRHSLNDHPLFKVERLLELARRLPDRCIEYNAGEIPMSIEHERTPLNGLSPEETIRRIAECKSWMVLKYVEQDGQYRELLEECLELVRPHSERIAPGMCGAQAFVFLTSPGSVTPYHIDPEHNFLLQIRGGKTIHMYDGRDRQLLTEEHLEKFYCDKGRNIPYQDWYEERAWVFDLQPGDGLHFPVTYPHWVQNQNEVSISFSITFRTPDLDRRRSLYQLNAGLREKGYRPSPVGSRPWRDSLLFNSLRIRRRVQKLLGKSPK
ncbi:MAG: cupin-like domain-containing protein [Planctomycetaceae bacterium]